MLFFSFSVYSVCSVVSFLFDDIPQTTFGRNADGIYQLSGGDLRVPGV